MRLGFADLVRPVRTTADAAIAVGQELATLGSLGGGASVDVPIKLVLDRALLARHDQAAPAGPQLSNSIVISSGIWQSGSAAGSKP